MSSDVKRCINCKHWEITGSRGLCLAIRSTTVRDWKDQRKVVSHMAIIGKRGVGRVDAALVTAANFGCELFSSWDDAA